MDMVAARHLKAEPPPKPPAKPQRSKKASAEPDQPTFFDDPNLQIPLNAGPNPGIPVAQVVGNIMTKVHRGNFLMLPEPVVTLKDEVMNRLDQFVHELKTEFPMLSAYDFTLNAVVPTGEQTEVRRPINKTIRIVLDRMNRSGTDFLSETDFLKSVEKAQASVTTHGGTIHRVWRYPDQGEAMRYELATSFEEVSSPAQAERIRDTIAEEIDCQHGVWLEE